jgi:hypothetical protein
MQYLPKGVGMTAKKVQPGWPEHGIDADDPALKAYFGIPSEDPAEIQAQDRRVLRLKMEGAEAGAWPQYGIDADDPSLTLYFKEENKASSDLLKKPSK